MEKYAIDIFKSYHQVHGAGLDILHEEKLDWFREYFKLNYLRFFDLHSQSSVLEVGCNKGYLLKVMEEYESFDIEGVDLSPEDIFFAQNVIGCSKVYCADALDFIKINNKKYDYILLKAVLEHIPKCQILPFLKGLKEGLSEKGKILIDVPNMDWLFASHERYMDFTHEVGFTVESLGQVCRMVFKEDYIGPIEPVFFSRKRKIFYKFLIKPIQNFFKKFLNYWGNSEGEILFEYRNIFFVGRGS